jgi:membrane protease YdiL (CAAX protease family)
MGVNALFIGPDGKVRSGWRFAIFVAGFIFLAGVLQVAVIGIFNASPGEGTGRTTAFFVMQGLSLLIPALLVGWLCNRTFDRLPFRSLGASFSQGSLKQFAIGIAVGSLTLALAVGVAVLFGGLSFTSDPVDRTSIIRTLTLSFIIFTVFAAWEEALFRGYPLQTFFHSGTKWFGVVFMAVLFATIHVGNPRADLLSWANTFLAGIWFGIAYLKTRQLWLPFGMHLMWNWMQGAFFGIEVSGLTDITSAPLLKEIDRGPGWLTGENYGIEAGVACTVALIVSTIVIARLSFPTRSDKTLLMIGTWHMPSKSAD